MPTRKEEELEYITPHAKICIECLMQLVLAETIEKKQNQGTYDLYDAYCSRQEGQAKRQDR